jgi:hypothetical protein
MRALQAVGVLLIGLAVPAIGLAGRQVPSDFEHGVVQYATTPPEDAIAQLQKRLDAGLTKLDYDKRWGYLPAVLDELKIPRSSQGLVFSKTSLQLVQISPKAPRALYFNDDVYIGAVQGGQLMEVVAVDPRIGPVFYSLPQNNDEPPRFEREFFACLFCHDSAATSGVPGFTMQSVLTDPEGVVIRPTGTIAMSDRTPFKERWGGWYVTGTHGDQRHWGNLVSTHKPDSLRDPQAFIDRLDLDAGANVKTLKDRFDAGVYLTEHSDLVALTVLNHQTRTHNLITKASYDVRTALHEDKAADTAMSAITRTRIETAVEPLLKAMAFTTEAPLTAPIAGTTTFARDFTAVGPRDSKGRSLRDFDLTTRLFKYRMSYLVYTPAFDNLPQPAKDYFYRRLLDVLRGTDQSRDFAAMPAAEKQAILEILSETKPEFAKIAAAAPRF